MARKRNGTSSGKKSRSKRSSRSTSVSTSPVSTPAAIPATPTETPVAEAMEATVPEPEPEPEKSEEGAQTQPGPEHEHEHELGSQTESAVDQASSQEDVDTKDTVPEKPAAVDEAATEEPAIEEPAADHPAIDQPEKTEDGKYSVDVSDLAADVAEREATEDLLDDLISFSEPAAEPESAAKEDPSAEATPVAAVAGSVNMEDSQAELLASNLDDSMYRSAMGDSAIDEVHALESSQEDLRASEIHENDILDSIRSIESTDRKYVVTPTAFAAAKGAEEIDSRPESAANNRAVDISADEAASAAAQVQADAQQVEASADAGSVESQPEQEPVAEEATSSAKTIAEPAGQSMAESYVHVNKEDDGLGESANAIVPEAPATSSVEKENKNTPVQDMTNREESEQVERAVSEVMDNAKEGTKDAANKASDAANNAGKKANKAASDAKDAADDAASDLSKKANKAASDAKDVAKEAADDLSKKARNAADSTADAANDAASKARDVLDNASKSVRDAASNVNGKAHDAMSKARESGEKLARKAREEAEEAEKAVKKQAKETPPATLRALGIVAAALAVVSGYYFRLPGRENQRLGFSSGVASAVIGLGTLATAFIKRNA